MTKFESYMGFCSKARKMVTGYNTVLDELGKGRIKLVILAGDLKDNSKDKLKNAANTMGVPIREALTIEELSHMTGKDEKGIYGIKDSNFANVIAKAIDDNN